MGGGVRCVGCAPLGVGLGKKVTRAGEEREGLCEGWSPPEGPLPEPRADVELDLFRLSHVWGITQQLLQYISTGVCASIGGTVGSN